MYTMFVCCIHAQIFRKALMKTNFHLPKINQLIFFLKESSVESVSVSVLCKSLIYIYICPLVSAG